MAIALKQKAKLLSSIILFIALVAGILVPSLMFAPEQAYARPSNVPVNYGNPFTNGDFYDYSGGKRVSGVWFHTSGSHIEYDGGLTPPFEYPLCYKKQAGTHPSYGTWGGGKFVYHDFVLTENSRDLKFSNMFLTPSTQYAYCIQHNNQDVFDIPRGAFLMLYENESNNELSSYWEGNVFHGTFFIQTQNTGGLGLSDQLGYDQSTALFTLVYADWIVEGDVSINKTSANTAITNNNSCYSLEGAKFGVYETETDANNDSNRLATLTTDEKGKTDKYSLAPGKYYVKESSASKGYALNSEVFPIEVKAGETATVNVKEKPLNDPAAIWLGKIDAATTENMPQGSASLANAQFTIKYYDGEYTKDNLPANATRTWVVKTDELGRSTLDSRYKVSGDEFYLKDGIITIPLGTITIQETKAPIGYKLNSELFIDVITAEDAIADTVETYNAPTIPEEVIAGDVEIYKRDINFGTTPYGNATLAGAVFHVLNISDNPVKTALGTIPNDGQTPAAILETNEQGVARTTGKYLPVGKYRVIEVAASNGYALNKDFSYEFSITKDGELHKASETCEEPWIYGGVKVGKIDRQNNSYTAQGSATLEGAEIEIINRSAGPIMYKNKRIEPGARVDVITTKKVDDKIVAATGEHDLPAGSYEVKEIKTSTAGYKYDDVSKGWKKTFSITQDGYVADFTGTADAVANEPIRSDFSFVKVMEQSGKAMAGIPFKVTSLTSGEWHILVTDANGEAGTDFAPHSQNTNANDSAYNKDTGEIDTDALSPENGVWFFGSSEQTEVKDSLGALPYDSYKVEELVCAANEGLQMISDTITVYREKAISPRTYTDFLGPHIETSLATTDDVISEKSSFTDTVTYANLENGKSYTMSAELYAWDKDGQDLGVVARATTEFKANATGRVDVVFEDVNTLALAGGKVVCFEKALDAEGKVVATHEDPNDEGQTVVIQPDTPHIEKYINQDVHKDILIDEVFTYDVMAYVPRDADTLVISDTLVDNLDFAADPNVRVALLQENNHLTNSVFTNINEDATVSAQGQAIEGAQVSVEGKNLSVAIDNALAYRGMWIRVTFDSVVAKDAEYSLIEDNGSVISDKAHEGIPNTASYTVGVGNNPNAYSLPSNTVTVRPENPEIEKYINKDVHQDLESSDEVFSYDVVAWVTNNAEAITITDELVENLSFVSKAEEIVVTDLGENNNHKTNNVYSSVNDDATINAEGEIIEGAYVSITNNTLMVRIDDASLYRGHWVRVSFKACIAQDIDYTTIKADAAEQRRAPNVGNAPVESDRDHEGIPNKASYSIDTKEKPNAYSDTSNTVTVKPPLPSIGTTALDAKSKTHYLEGSSDAKVVDSIAYTNLIVGASYYVSGYLVDPQTGQALSDVYTCEFVAQEANGSVDLEISLDASELAGKTLVAFEELYLGPVPTDAKDGEDKPTPLAEHKDPNDEGQTVYVISIATQAKDKESGTHYIDSTTDEKITIVDTVKYTGLIKDQDYTLRAQMVNVATGEAVSDYVVKEFVAQGSEGSVDVEVGIAPVSIGEGALVAFEELYLGKLDKQIEGELPTPIAEHKDPKDPEQSIYPLSLKTSASDGSGKSEIDASSNAHIVDTVSYTGLVPGKTYTFVGELQDKSSGRPLMVGGKTITAYASFTASAASGSQTVEFNFDARELEGKTLVVFETAYEGQLKGGVPGEDDKPIGKHADIKDPDQTIKVKSTPGTDVPKGSTPSGGSTPGKFYDKTGTVLVEYWWVVALLAAAIAGAAGFALHYKRKADIEDKPKEVVEEE